MLVFAFAPLGQTGSNKSGLLYTLSTKQFNTQSRSLGMHHPLAWEVRSDHAYQVQKTKPPNPHHTTSFCASRCRCAQLTDVMLLDSVALLHALNQLFSFAPASAALPRPCISCSPAPLHQLLAGAPLASTALTLLLMTSATRASMPMGSATSHGTDGCCL